MSSDQAPVQMRPDAPQSTAEVAGPAREAQAVNLAQALREATWALHGQAERAGIMPALLGGRLAPHVFHALQRNLHALYEVMEAGLLQGSAHPVLAPLQDTRLPRAARLAADLDDLHGLDWREALPLLPATRAYLDRLRSLSHAQPAGLVAHAYVRYLGDLAGGQSLARCVVRAFDLKEGRGTSFFHFGAPDQARALALAFRSRLAELDPSAGERAVILAEAQWSFGQHVRLFEELAAV
ncbi:MAG: hypothetical protein RL722_1185 [Pseudomonadota bacterium]|jgi:heme oxygenase